MNREHIRNLLADAVQAKLDYWDANSALEYALAGDTISDRDSDRINALINLIAAGANDGSDVTIEHVDDLLNRLQDLHTKEAP